MTLTIWGRLNSHNVKKVCWAAMEAGIPWRRIDMGGTFGYTDAYLAMNPNRLVPAIEDDSVPGGFSLWESNAILRYIADAHAPYLWPGTPARRAQADKWMDWQFSYADAQRDAFLQLVRHKPEQRDAALIERSATACTKLMAMLDETLARQPWLSGGTFGIADIPMGTYAYTWYTLGLPRAELPHVATWYERIRIRPGFAEQVAIPLT